MNLSNVVNKIDSQCLQNYEKDLCSLRESDYFKLLWFDATES